MSCSCTSGYSCHDHVGHIVVGFLTYGTRCVGEWLTNLPVNLHKMCRWMTRQLASQPALDVSVNDSPTRQSTCTRCVGEWLTNSPVNMHRLFLMSSTCTVDYYSSFYVFVFINTPQLFLQQDIVVNDSCRWLVNTIDFYLYNCVEAFTRCQCCHNNATIDG